MKSLLGIIILIFEIIAIIDVIKSSKDTGKKVLWIVLIVLLPVIGFNTLLPGWQEVKDIYS